MAKQYDAAIKHLIEAHAADWLTVLGLPPTTPVEVIDADVSSISAAADKVLLVHAAEPFVFHVEFQTGVDVEVDERTLFYNVVLRWRRKLPVVSIVLMLHPRAMTGATGRVVSGTSDSRIEFQYRWEQPAETWLNGPLGLLPLAPLGAASDAELADIIQKVEQRIERDAPPEESKDLLTAAYLLTGVRHGAAKMRQLLKGANLMDVAKYSSTPQVLAELAEERGMRTLILDLARQRFGEPGEQALAALGAVEDRSQLKAIARRIFDATSWDELLSGHH